MVIGSQKQIHTGVFQAVQNGIGAVETGKAADFVGGAGQGGFEVNHGTIGRLKMTGYIGENAGEIIITGGGASSPLWAGIKSDVTGKVLKSLSESETGCLGTALVAAVGIGAFESISDAAKNAVRIKNIYTPKENNYDSAYENFLNLDTKMN